MSQLSPKQSQCLAVMIEMSESLGRMPRHHEVAAVLGVTRPRVSQIYTSLYAKGYLSINPTEILLDETGRRVRAETTVKVRRRGA